MIQLFHFRGGETGEWAIRRIAPVIGPVLPPATRLAVVAGDPVEARAPGLAWNLRGVVTNLRYATGDEVSALAAVQPGLARPEAQHAALIPIRKSATWWALPQDRRRAIFEETSHHTRIGMEYLPAVARRLHHSRDLGEPFDFLTWFEYAPAAEPAFDDLLARLRATEEWRYVEREVDVRLHRPA